MEKKTGTEGKTETKRERTTGNEEKPVSLDVSA